MSDDRTPLQKIGSLKDDLDRMMQMPGWDLYLAFLRTQMDLIMKVMMDPSKSSDNRTFAAGAYSQLEALNTWASAQSTAFGAQIRLITSRQKGTQQ